jgi:hypothetical protein
MAARLFNVSRAVVVLAEFRDGCRQGFKFVIAYRTSRARGVADSEAMPAAVGLTDPKG